MRLMDLLIPESIKHFIVQILESSEGGIPCAPGVHTSLRASPGGDGMLLMGPTSLENLEVH